MYMTSVVKGDLVSNGELMERDPIVLRSLSQLGLSSGLRSKQLARKVQLVPLRPRLLEPLHHVVVVCQGVALLPLEDVH